MGSQWNGIVGMLAKSEADMSTAGMSLTYSRSRVVDYTFPLLEHQACIMNTAYEYS